MGTEFRPSIPVFYTPLQSTRVGASFSPSAGKPELVVEAWLATGLPIALIEPRPAGVEDICRAHDPAYVEAVLSCRRPNGFGSTSTEIAATLPWTTGSLMSAAEHALSTGESAFSPTSGFHHAGWEEGAAFCTFNGLMVTALSLHSRGLIRSIAILDCDQHFGDGTRDIIRQVGAGWVRHYSYGAEPASRNTAATWLMGLQGLVNRTARGADLVLYQAGADPHVDDPLGGGLTTEQMATRDRIVFETCAALAVPVVTNLAGGYQRPVDRVVALHVQTLREFAAVHGFVAG